MVRRDVSTGIGACVEMMDRSLNDEGHERVSSGQVKCIYVIVHTGPGVCEFIEHKEDYTIRTPSL